MADDKKLHVIVKDRYERVIYENTCINKCHYETVKFLLLKMREGNTVDNSLLKPMRVK